MRVTDQEVLDEEFLYEDDDPEPEARAPDEEFSASGEFIEDLTALATQYVDSFFQDKFLHCGKVIPGHLKHAPWRISLVMNTLISKGIKWAYHELEKDINPQEIAQAERLGFVTNDIKLVNDALTLLAASGVPKCFAGGMLLLYLEFCEGMRLSTSPPPCCCEP